jgi:hypothetical protein
MWPCNEDIPTSSANYGESGNGFNLDLLTILYYLRVSRPRRSEVVLKSNHLRPISTSTSLPNFQNEDRAKFMLRPVQSKTSHRLSNAVASHQAWHKIVSFLSEHDTCREVVGWDMWKHPTWNEIQL